MRSCGGVQAALDVIVEVRDATEAVLRSPSGLSLLPVRAVELTSTPLPHGDEKTRHVRSMFDAIAPRHTSS